MTIASPGVSGTPAAPLRTVVLGLGAMGLSHALAYHDNPGFAIVGLHNRSRRDLPEALRDYPCLDDVEAALALAPDLVSINTYTDSHADLAIRSMEAGAHVFVEKPLATTLDEARRVVEAAGRTERKLVVGYILRHHPSWQRFIEEARQMGPPFVFRLNLNQRSFGPAWETHKRLMETTSPLVDCGVHYIDVMLQITDARPTQVRGMGVRLSDEIAETQVNYGHLQVLFADGSVGWYEAGWGPMMSDTAFFVKDVVGPKGAVSIVVEEGTAMEDGAASADHDTHTRTYGIRLQSSRPGADGGPPRDVLLDRADEPSHQDLCAREQAFVLEAIRDDLDLTRHMADALRSLEIVLAADRSMREGRAIDL